jgi:hypothetical protein
MELLFTVTLVLVRLAHLLPVQPTLPELILGVHIQKLRVLNTIVMDPAVTDIEGVGW